MTGLALALALISNAPLANAQSKPAPAPPAKVKVGDVAPDFTLLAWDGSGPPKPVSLRDFRGKKNVALAFFVFAFTGG
jgi:hypothetical protein